MTYANSLRLSLRHYCTRASIAASVLQLFVTASCRSYTVEQSAAGSSNNNTAAPVHCVWPLLLFSRKLLMRMKISELSENCCRRNVLFCLSLSPLAHVVVVVVVVGDKADVDAGGCCCCCSSSSTYPGEISSKLQRPISLTALGFAHTESNLLCKHTRSRRGERLFCPRRCPSFP